MVTGSIAVVTTGPVLTSKLTSYVAPAKPPPLRLTISTVELALSYLMSYGWSTGQVVRNFAHWPDSSAKYVVKV
jgi:hypothetical protein